MEEPQEINELAAAEPRSSKAAKTSRAPGVRKKRMGGVALAFVVVLITFALGAVLCVVPGFAINEQVTNFFSANSDLDQVGVFFAPFLIFTIDFSGWATTSFGSFFGELTIIIGAVLVIVPFIATQGECKKAKKENRKPVELANAKLYKYGWLPVLPFLAGCGIWLLLWLLGQEGMFSLHVVVATSTTGLALAYIGSRKKALSIVFACASTFYSVMMGIARMATGDSTFLAVLIAGFVTFALVVFSYFSILDIPGQEMIYRHKSTYGPFNEGYKLILEGKANLKVNQADAFKSVTEGMEKLAAAKANAEDINKYHHSLDAFIARIDDITGRVGVLLQKQPVSPKDWSYIC